MSFASRLLAAARFAALFLKGPLQLPARAERGAEVRGRNRGPLYVVASCEWCSAPVSAPTARELSRDEQGDVCCADCLILPPWYVAPGRA